jgi:hypothetical protein
VLTEVKRIMQLCTHTHTRTHTHTYTHTQIHTNLSMQPMIPVLAVCLLTPLERTPLFRGRRSRLKEGAALGFGSLRG